MKFELKPLSVGAIDSALERAQTYRLLNEPLAAESICRDVLLLDEHHQAAQIELILSLSDQFPLKKTGLVKEATQIASELSSDYHRAYYSGIVLERRALAHLASRTPGAGEIVYDWLRDGMQLYEQAEQLRPAGNDESILRWNTCARIIMSHPEIREREPGDRTVAHFDT